MLVYWTITSEFWSPEMIYNKWTGKGVVQHHASTNPNSLVIVRRTSVHVLCMTQCRYLMPCWCILIDFLSFIKFLTPFILCLVICCYVFCPVAFSRMLPHTACAAAVQWRQFGQLPPSIKYDYCRTYVDGVIPVISTISQHSVVIFSRAVDAPLPITTRLRIFGAADIGAAVGGGRCTANTQQQFVATDRVSAGDAAARIWTLYARIFRIEFGVFICPGRVHCYTYPCTVASLRYYMDVENVRQNPTCSLSGLAGNTRVKYF